MSRIIRGILTASIVGFCIWLLVVDENVRTGLIQWCIVSIGLLILAMIIWVIWSFPRED